MPSDTNTQGLFNQAPLSPPSPVAEAPLDISPSAQTVGALLRSRRKELGLPLEEFYKRTRIRVVLLEALEEEDLKSLPENRTTVRSYVRAYAKSLDLEPEMIVQQFNDLHYPHVEKKIVRHPKPLPSLPTNTILFLSIALLLVVVFIGVMQNLLDQPEESIPVKLSPPPIDEQRAIQQTGSEILPPPTVPQDETPVVSLAQEAQKQANPILTGLRLSHTAPLWVNMRSQQNGHTVFEMHLLEPAEALNFALKQDTSLHIPDAENVMLMLIDQHQKITAEVPYQAIADNEGWIHFDALTQE